MSVKLPLGGLVVALLFSSVGCGGGGSVDSTSEAGKLSTARATWFASGTRSYRFTITRSAFLVPEYVGPAKVTVTNGVVTKVEPAGSNSIAAGAFDNCDTIEELFARAQGGIETDGATVNGTYDAITGVPKTISIDPIPMAADDEISYIVSDFQSL